LAERAWVEKPQALAMLAAAQAAATMLAAESWAVVSAVVPAVARWVAARLELQVSSPGSSSARAW